MVAGWWVHHGWPAVPSAILPKFGIVAHNEEKDLGAAWLYMDNSVGVCWMEWLVTSPACLGRMPIKVIRIIAGFLKSRALDMDYGVMMTTARQASLVRVLESNGFTKSDEGMTHLISILR